MWFWNGSVLWKDSCSFMSDIHAHVYAAGCVCVQTLKRSDWFIAGMHSWCATCFLPVVLLNQTFFFDLHNPRFRKAAFLLLPSCFHISGSLFNQNFNQKWVKKKGKNYSYKTNKKLHSKPNCCKFYPVCRGHTPS